MTSSNAAPTDEGRAAVAMASPLLAAAAEPPSPPRPGADGDASGAALTTTSSAPDASLTLTLDAPAAIKQSDTLDEPPTDTQQPPSADRDQDPSQPQSNQPQPDQLSNEMNIDLAIPSPPTVSPLSTPAATHVNVDENLSDDALAKLTADLPPLSLTRDSSIFRSGIFDALQPANHRALSAPGAMELDEPFMPDNTGYHRRSQVEAIATTDPDPHGADYSSHGLLSGMRLSQGSIDPNAYIMNLAAQATLFQDQGPSVIHPSAVSLHSFTQDSDVLTGSAEPASTNGSQKLESFARIEFADSTFQMTTYAVIIGRDKQAMEQARADERREAAYRRKCEENERNGLPPPTPIMYDRGKFSKSYVSEEGGMLGPEHSDGEDVEPPKRRRPSSAAQSATGEDNAPGNHVKSNRQYVSHTPGAAAVDLGALQPSPGHIPFIGIHSPGPDIASKTRGISRQHLKIQFNKKRGVFEGIALHKNGFFCEDVLYGLDQPATLRSGDRLQIKDVEFFFVINGVQNGMSGGEDEDVASSKRMSVGGKEMSLDFEHSDHENFRDTSEELSDVENIPSPAVEPDHSEGQPAPTPTPASVPAPAPTSGPIVESGPAPEPDPEATGAQSIGREEQLLTEIIKPELDMLGELPPDFAMPEIPKRRGPGRPPKDGIMSKRERRLLKKQMQETSKKTVPQDPQEEKIKRPVGRPRKNPLPEDGERPEKRKYNKKKREDGEEGSDVEKRTKEKKDKKVRPKSPPLELRLEDYTPDQLQKPTKNYGVLIDEALTNGPPDGLTLKQIYKRITARYPWFYFTAETKGWESSVRHNLIGNDAFKKSEETGLWSRVPGVELDAGKKRKITSPDRHLGPSHLHSHLSHPPYYQNSPYANPGSAAYPHGLSNYSTEQKHTQPSYPPAGQNTQLHTAPSQPTTQPVYAAQVPAPAQLPAGYGNLAVPRPSNTAQQSTYSSPYARPPPPSNPPAKVEANLANGQTPASTTAQSATPTQVQQQAQQQQQQSRPSAPAVVQREQLSPEIERAIMQFSANMLNVISKQTPHAATIIEAAANRVRGLPVQNRVPGFDSVETTLVNAMQGMIRDMKQKHHYTTSASPAPSAPAQASSTPSPAPPNTVEAEIQRRLRNFRESMVTALKTKTDKAEVIVDSAINRARGLPHAGKIPGWEEADNLMVKSVTQIIAEARSAHSLKLQNASPTPANPNRTAVSQTPQPVLRTEPPAPPVSAQTSVTSTVPQVAPSNGMPAAPYTPSAPNSNSPSTARPSMPLQRPAPVALTRPPTTPMVRPTFHKDPTTAPTMATTAAPPVPRPNVSSPAPPSAGVLDQITGHKRFTDDFYSKSHSITNPIATGSHTGSNTAASSNTVKNPSVGMATSSSMIHSAPSSIATNNTAGNPASNATSNAAIKAAGSAISNTTSNGAGSSVGNLPTVASINSVSNSTGNPPSNITGPSKSSVTGVASSSVVGDHIGTISSTSNLVTTSSNVASDASGGASRVTAGHIPSSTIGNSSSDSNTSNTATAGIVGRATPAKNGGTTGNTTGANPSFVSGQTLGGTASSHTRTTTSTSIGQVDRADDAQISSTVAQSANSSKVGNEKGALGKVTAIEHHDAAALKAPAPVHNMSSPAPPSAGVVDQIAGHKRSLDEGPGSANAEQPEAKRLGVSST
ncbi:hypothetical protein F5Y10DRAFT_229011 [Nemania abortiva]|nr:hypothetical protein F5Y10DRAFT_229011 [Nemania abortiva]